MEPFQPFHSLSTESHVAGNVIGSPFLVCQQSTAVGVLSLSVHAEQSVPVTTDTPNVLYVLVQNFLYLKNFSLLIKVGFALISVNVADLFSH